MLADFGLARELLVDGDASENTSQIKSRFFNHMDKNE